MDASAVERVRGWTTVMISAVSAAKPRRRIDAMRFLRSLRQLSWRKLFFYSEALGVLFAWGIGLLIALDREPQPAEPIDADTVASAVPGDSLAAPRP